MENNKIKLFGIFWLTISLVFIININFSYGATITNEQAQQSCVPGLSNPKSSIVMSVLTLCLPGILEKTHEWKQIKCQTIQCYYTAVKNELDPSFCMQQEAYRTCSYITGELFAATPLGLIDSIRQQIADLLANPIGVLFSAGKIALQTSVASKCSAPGPCTSAWSEILPQRYGLAAMDIAAAAQTIMEMIENGFNYFNGAPNACEGIEDIKAEMEEILQYA